MLIDDRKRFNLAKFIKICLIVFVVLVVLLINSFDYKNFNNIIGKEFELTKENLNFILDNINNQIAINKIGFLKSNYTIPILKVNDNRQLQQQQSTVNNIVYNKTSCADYQNPRDKYECKKVNISSLINNRQHTCCFLRMTSPKLMNVCVPVENVFLPINNMVTTIKLPSDFNIDGTVDCKGSNYILNTQFLFTILSFFIFLN